MMANLGLTLEEFAGDAAPAMAGAERDMQSAIGNILNNARNLNYGELTLSSCNI